MSIQFDNRGEVNSSAESGDATGETAHASGSGTGGQNEASNMNWGSARSDYGDRAYEGSLDAEGLGGKSYDDFSEGGREAGSKRKSTLSSTRSGGGGSKRRAGYSLDSGNAGLTLLAGMVVGATLMYIFDPQQGGRRRALLRDKLVGLSNDAADVLGKTSRDLRNRAQGVIAETTRAVGLGGQSQASDAGSDAAQGASNTTNQQASAAGTGGVR
jgi:hypothetical protein